MAYRIVQADTQGVRLLQTSTGWVLAAIGFMVGGSILLAGLALFASGLSGWTMLTMVGAAFAIVPWIVIGTRSHIDPQEIVFDNVGGMVALVQRSRRGTVAGFVPYQDIRGFGIRTESMRQNGTASSTGSTVSRRHFLYFERRDDATWDLVSSGSSAAVQDMQRRLQKYVDFSRSCDTLPDAPLPPGLAVHNRDAVLELSWRNPITPLLLMPYLILGAFFSILRQFTVMAPGSGNEDMDWLAWAMGGIGAMVGILVTVNILREVNRRKRLRIDARNLEMATISRGGTVHRATTIPLEEIVDVRFDFSDTAGASPIRVLTTEDEAVARRIQGWKLSFADLKTAVQNSMTHQIDLGLLTTAEKLNVVNFIQRTIDYRRGRRSAPPQPASVLSSYWWTTRAPVPLSSRLLTNTTLGVLMILTAPLQVFILGMLLIPGELNAVKDYFHMMTIAESIIRSVFPLIGALRLGQAGHKILPALLAVTTALMLLSPYAGSMHDLTSWANLLLIPLAIYGGIQVLRLGDI